MSAATRRAALGAILAAPLASVPATAGPAVSPDLARLIAECAQANDALRAAHSIDSSGVPPWPLIRAAGLTRASVAQFPCAGPVDARAKAWLLLMIYSTDELREESRPDDEGHAHVSDLALHVLADLLDLMEAGQ